MFQAVRLNAGLYPVEQGERAELARADATLLEIDGNTATDILNAAQDCDALLVVSSALPAQVVENLKRCRVIARLGAGTDKIAVDVATRHGIVVANVPDFCLDEQAEHTLALFLAFARRLPYMMEAMRQGQWAARNHAGVHRVAGRALGLVGFGASAQAVAARARGFGLRILAWTRRQEKYRETAKLLGVELGELDDVLARSDFVSVHLPLTGETRHLIDARRLALLKPSAVLINTARGAIVDEAALVALLREGKIAGAALDVFEEIDVFVTPGTLPQHPLLALDNVLLTPHCAGSSVESALESKVRGARYAADVLLGNWPAYVVNPEVVPRFALRRSCAEGVGGTARESRPT